MRDEQVTPGRLLRAGQVRQMPGVDRSTVYLMAENGRLPAVIQVTAEILGVRMTLTDTAGEPLTDVVNPCAWYTAHKADPDLLEACRQDRKRLARDPGAPRRGVPV
ncbi:MAG TPA: PocR ligand-binding domain-containing protein [Trebonia sp.]|nr:PocR ligand-binding domain-containing protein [Trebonia sp.]